MKPHLILGAVGVLALGPAVVATTASAETLKPPGVWEGKTSQSVGRTVSFEGGKLRIAVGTRGKRFDYVVDKATRCGYSRGNRGTGMRCAELAEKRYRSKPVRVVWHTDAKKRRIAVAVAVILSPPR